MDKKAIIWSVVIAAFGVGVYFLVDHLINSGAGEEDGNEDNGEKDPNQPSISYATQSDKPRPSQWVQKGSNGIEVEKVQIIFNDIRSMARKRVAAQSSGSGVHSSAVLAGAYSGDKQRRLEAVAALPYLKVDGNFGDKTKAVCQKIMGNHGTNLCNARKKRRDFALAYGYENPYKNWSKIC